MKSLTENVIINMQVVSTLALSLLIEYPPLLQLFSKLIPLKPLSVFRQYGQITRAAFLNKVDLLENSNSQPKMLTGNWEN
jgi:hypothetical protein